MQRGGMLVSHVNQEQQKIVIYECSGFRCQMTRILNSASLARCTERREKDGEVRGAKGGSNSGEGSLEVEKYIEEQVKELWRELREKMK